jgi:hypothetical protein
MLMDTQKSSHPVRRNALTKMHVSLTEGTVARVKYVSEALCNRGLHIPRSVVLRIAIDRGLASIDPDNPESLTQRVEVSIRGSMVPVRTNEIDVLRQTAATLLDGVMGRIPLDAVHIDNLTRALEDTKKKRKE